MALRQILWDCGIGTDHMHGGAAGRACVKEEEAVGELPRHRVLVFAQMKTMLDIIETDLLQRELPGVTYLRMDGATPTAKRFEVQQQFNGDPSIDVLLLTTHVGGLGLNLTGADTVVFVEHDWNPMRDLQVSVCTCRVCLRARLLLVRAPLRVSVCAHAREGAEGAVRRERSGEGGVRGRPHIRWRARALTPDSP